MVGSAVCFTLYLVFARQGTEGNDPGVVAFLRGAITLVLVVPFVLRAGVASLATHDPWKVVTRSAFGTLGFLAAIYSLSPAFGMPLSQFSAISYSRTLFVVVLAALILREPVGWRRWAATGVGFIGVFVMVGPSGGFSVGSALALASSASFAASIILMKTLSARYTALTILVHTNALSTVMLAPLAIWHWQTPAMADWLGLTLMAGSGAAAQFCYIAAMRLGDASFLAPMDYLRLPMTATADWITTRLLPGLSVWLGAGIIVASTLYIAWREARLGRTPPPKGPAGS